MVTDFDDMSDVAYFGNAVRLLLPLPDGICTLEDFWRLCELNPEVIFERNADGSIIVDWPRGGETGRRNACISVQLGNWDVHAGLGVAFASCVGFQFPSGAVRSPDASWMTLEKWNSYTPQEREKIPVGAPDFALELNSCWDSISHLQDKMREYIDAGVRLGWLIDPETRSVEIYRPRKDVERIENASSVSGDPELPGFVLDLGKVW